VGLGAGEKGAFFRWSGRWVKDGLGSEFDARRDEALDETDLI
jgi:hypothetical protein